MVPTRSALSVVAACLVLAACSGTAQTPPTIGAPLDSQSATASAAPGRPDQLRAKWDLTGVDLPNDWPDVPVPKGTTVASAYAVDSAPRRTWTASFLSESDKRTASKMAKPVAAALLDAGYQPVSAYTPDDPNAGLLSFSGPQYSVYLVLGDRDGHPNVVMTVRQRGADESGTPGLPSSSTLPEPGASTTATSRSGADSAAADPAASAGRSMSSTKPVASASPPSPQPTAS